MEILSYPKLPEVTSKSKTKTGVADLDANPSPRLHYKYFTSIQSASREMWYVPVGTHVLGWTHKPAIFITQKLVTPVSPDST